MHMLSLMEGTCAVGLAATQAGIPVSLFVTLCGGSLRVFVDPVVVSYGKRMRTMVEGCMSVPDVFLPVERPDTVKITYSDAAGVRRTDQFSGLLSRVVQHEYDHLGGKMFLDLLNSTQRAGLPKDVLAALEADLYADNTCADRDAPVRLR